MNIWINGEIIPRDKACIALNDRGLLLADGFFETILIQNGLPVFFKEHIERMFRAADVFDVPMPYTANEIRGALLQLVSREGLAEGSASARITVTRGPGTRGIIPPEKADAEPVVFISVVTMSSPASTPVSLMISDVRRNEGSPISRMKTLSYTDNILARTQAIRSGVKDAVLLNNKNQVCCTTVGNIFLIQPDDVLVTPCIESGILAGITREKVIEAAKGLGITVQERLVDKSELGNCELFLTNSLLGLMRAHLHEIIPSSKVAVFSKLQACYTELLQEDLSKFRHA